MHTGKTLRKIVEESSLHISEISEKTSINRGTLYNWFKTPNLPFEKANQVFSKIGYRLSEDEFKVMSVSEDPATYFTNAQKSHDLNFKDQYLSLLEKHTSMMEELMSIKDELAQYKREYSTPDRAEKGTDSTKNKKK